jgi:phospholipase D-like protein
MLKILIYAIPLFLAVFALVDLVQTKDEDVQGLPKLVWVLLIVLIGVVGPVIWLLAGRRGRNPLAGFLPPRVEGTDPSRRQSMAPDDDPDFLRGLNRPRPPEDDGSTPPAR